MSTENPVSLNSLQSGLTKKEIGILAIHAFFGWALCAAAMGISLATTTEQNALIVHAVGAPVFYFVISRIYFSKYNFTTPFQTGLVFVGFVILMDFFVVSMLVLKNFEMFASLLGTWIPFALIFTSTYLTGFLTIRNRKPFPVA